MNADRWKRRLTLVYVAAWAFWVLIGLLTVIGYPGSTDGARYPRVVGGVLLACVVLPAFLLVVLRQAFDRFANASRRTDP